jgi:hypothetical protein
VTKTDNSSIINQLFAGMHCLIFYSMTKMSSLIPAPGSTLDDFFLKRIPKIKPEDAAKQANLLSAPSS